MKKILIAIFIIIIIGVLGFIIFWPNLASWNDFYHYFDGKSNAFEQHIKFADFKESYGGMGYGSDGWLSNTYELYTDGSLICDVESIFGIVNKRSTISKEDLVLINKFLREKIKTGQYHSEDGYTVFEHGFFSEVVNSSDGCVYTINYYETDGNSRYTFIGNANDKIEEIYSLMDRCLGNN